MIPDPIIIGDATLYCGDCLDILPTLAAGSVDAVVTDPQVWPGVYTAPITRTNKPDSEIGKLLARYGYKADDSNSFLR